MHKFLFSFTKKIVFVLFVLSFVAPCLAADLMLGSTECGGENIWVTNMWDHRRVSETAPNAGMVGSVGGWYLGFAGPEASSLGLVGKVEFTGNKRTIIINEPYAYHWLGSDDIGFDNWFGNRITADDTFIVRFYDKTGALMEIYDCGAPIGTELWPLTPHINIPSVPFVKIKNLHVRKNDLMVKILVPEDLAGRDTHLRLRIYEGKMGDINLDRMIKEIRYYPPFEIVKKDGTIIPNKAKLSVPLEYSGQAARIEYRAYGGAENYPMARSVMYLTLPSLEE